MKWRFSGRFAALVPVSVVVVILSSCSGEVKKEETSAVQSAGRQDSPANMSDVELRTLDGRSARISDYKGKILFVTFWASWHGDSQKIIPMLNVIQSKYHKNVQVLAVAMDDQGAPAVSSWLADKRVRFDVFVEGDRTANGFGGARNLPTTYILLRDGTVYNRLDGLKRLKYYEDTILSMYRQHL